MRLARLDCVGSARFNGPRRLSRTLRHLLPGHLSVEITKRPETCPSPSIRLTLCFSVFCNEYTSLPADTPAGPLPNQWPGSSRVRARAFPVPTNVLPGLSGPQTREERGCGSMGAPMLTSPFKDCLGSFGKGNQLSFARPQGGKINGYIKFNWPNSKQDLCAPVRGPVPGRATAITSVASIEPMAHTSTSLVPSSSISDRSAIFAAVAGSELGVDTSAPPSRRRNLPAADCQTIVTLPSTNAGVQSVNVTMDSPRRIPELFGYDAKMDATDRKLWTFCMYLKPHHAHIPLTLAEAVLCRH